MPKPFSETDEQIQEYQKDDVISSKRNWNERISRSPLEIDETNLMLSPPKPNFIETNCSLSLESLPNGVFRHHKRL